MKKTGAQQPNQMLLWGILGTVVAGCVVYVYMQFSPSTSTPPPSAPVALTTPATVPPPSTGKSKSTDRPVPGMKAEDARNLGTLGQLDPALHMASMEVTESLAYAGSGRNIFSPNSAPPVQPIPKVIAPVRPVGPPPVQIPTGPPPPPPPPPIDLKFFGTSTSMKGKRQAFLLHGDDVSVAGEGEVVSRRYKVISIGTNSVIIEDMQYNNRQTLPVEAQ